MATSGAFKEPDFFIFQRANIGLKKRVNSGPHYVAKIMTLHVNIAQCLLFASTANFQASLSILCLQRINVGLNIV